MKIAQIAPLTESVPPKLYGGTERIVSYLTEELVRQGHEVTLFASGDSITAARLAPITPVALRLDAKVRDPLPYQIMLLERVRQCAEGFDVLHFHIDLMQFPLLRTLRTPSVTTLHGRLDLARARAALSHLPRSGRSSRSRTVSGCHCPRCAGSAPSSMGCRATCSASHQPRSRALSGLSRAHLAREAPRPRH